MSADTAELQETHNVAEPEKTDSARSHYFIPVVKRKYPDSESLWRGMPFWMLVIVQWILAFGITLPIMIVLSLLWPVACVYYHNVGKTLGNDIQVVLALMGTIFAVILYPIALLITVVGGLIMWIIWIVRDIKAISKQAPRPQLLPEKYQGLYGFVN